MRVIEPGHVYAVHNHENDGEQTISFIKKEKREGPYLVTVGEGTTTEEILRVAADRLGFLYSQLPDRYTKAAKYFIGQAIGILEERTADRKDRNVEGTHQK